MKALVLLVVLAVAITAVVWFSNQGKTPSTDSTPEGAPGAVAPTGGASNAAVIPAANFRVEDYKGQVLVMDFWATWCPPCRMAMPGVQKLHEHFQGRPVKVVGVNCSETGDPIEYMKKNGFTYTTVTGADALASKYKLEGIPTFVILGVNGEQLTRTVGYDPGGEAKFTALIEEHLKKNGL